MPRFSLFALAAAFIATPLATGSVAAQEHPIVLKATVILDGTGQVLRNTIIVVEAGKIARPRARLAGIRERRRNGTRGAGNLETRRRALVALWGRQGCHAARADVSDSPDDRREATPLAASWQGASRRRADPEAATLLRTVANNKGCG